MSDTAKTRRYARLERHGDQAAQGPQSRAVFAEIVGGEARLLDGAPWLGGVPTGEVWGGFDEEARGEAARRLVPVAPKTILCVGRNYKAHAQELGNEVPKEPLLFLKPVSSLLGPDGAVELPPRSISERVEHEAELGVIIGRRVRRVSPEEAKAAIFGCTLVFDITARDLQKKDGQWTRAKGMDTFCPVGPVVVTGLDVASLALRCEVNGEVRQRGETSQTIFSVPEVIAYASQVITLEPGDLLVTGTPPGVGPLAAGDALSLTIAEIGALRLSVVGPP